jgi:hypothetical protein
MPSPTLNEVRCASCNACIYAESAPVHPLCKPSCRLCSPASPVFTSWQVPQARPRWQDISEFTYYHEGYGKVCALGASGFQISKGYEPRPAPDWIVNPAMRRRVCSSHSRGASSIHWDWVLYWYFLIGMPPRHIAEELGISPNAVELQIKRLLKRAQRTLSEKEPTQSTERAARVVELREAGLSWREIERRTGIPRSTASRLVSHATDPKHQGYMRGALHSVVAATHLILPRDEKGLLTRPRLASLSTRNVLPAMGLSIRGAYTTLQRNIPNHKPVPSQTVPPCAHSTSLFASP